MCLNKKILYQYFVGLFYSLWNSFSPENILYVITQP